MPPTTATLGQAFLACIAAFNAYDRTIAGYLDNNVQVHSVHRNVVVTGLQAVQQYLTGQFGDNPYFDPGQENLTYQISVDPANNSGTVKTIPGEAGRWRDNNNTHGRFENIRFTFGFRWDGAQWRLLSALALP